MGSRKDVMAMTAPPRSPRDVMVMTALLLNPREMMMTLPTMAKDPVMMPTMARDPRVMTRDRMDRRARGTLRMHQMEKEGVTRWSRNAWKLCTARPRDTRTRM